MSENALKVGLNSLEKAKNYISLKNYGRAFAHYLVHLELCPELRQEHRDEFIEVLFKWTYALEKRQQIEGLVKCYLHSLQYFPSDVEVLNNFGANLLSLGEIGEAKKYLKLANALDQNYLPAEKNLFTAKLHLVPRWHFRMLNDYKRSTAFKKAILSSISTEYSKVLDIGTGTGILSLFASLHENIEQIIAVEESNTLCKVAQNIVKGNNVENIRIVNSKSTDLIGSDFSNVLITEIFDTALFGEHVLETLIHAWENLLENGAKVIPSSANLFIMGIECEDIHKRHKVLNSHPEINLNIGCISQMITEPYEAENLKMFNFRVATNKHEIKIDFMNLEQLKNLYTNPDAVESFSLHCLQNTTVHAFAIWFDLNLDESTQITTNPFRDNCECWEQAIFYVDHPIAGRDAINLKLSCMENKLEIKILDAHPCNNCYKVSSEIITFLNDEALLNRIGKIAGYFDEECEVLDLNPFPIFGLLMAKKSSRTTCLIKHRNDEIFLKHICDKNNIQNMEFLAEEQLEIVLQRTGVFDIVFLNPVMSDGIINEKIISEFVLFQNVLKPNGIILPKTVEIAMQLVESQQLDFFTKTNDNNCHGFKIAEFINEYAVPEQWVLRPKDLQHISLTSTHMCSNIMQNDNTPIVEQCSMKVTKAGRANGILYWYKISYLKDISFDTYYSTHYNCACFLLGMPRNVDERDSIDIYVKHHRGLLKIYY